MNFKECLHRVKVCSPHEVPYRTARFFWRKLKKVKIYQVDKRFPTYAKTKNVPEGELNTYFKTIPTEVLRAFSSEIAGVTQHYLAHRFDLLGSGWVLVKYGMRCRGLEGNRYDIDSPGDIDSTGVWMQGWINEANLRESMQIWTAIDSDYMPIDWQVDFKSGYRWDQKVWYREVGYSPLPGVDIKVPWELARMQHLSHLAWAYALAKDGQKGFAEPEMYVREFRNQVLDFIATNPPRFGPNWQCTMEIGLRVSNWLVAYDFFKQYGAKFDHEFEVIFHRSIYEHGLHIINNLEWFPEITGNHYLANVVGLLFAAAYLPRTAETDAWLAFSVHELIKEVQTEFHPDGSNFEASTNYHRLSAEMVVYATALVLGLTADKHKALKNYNHKKIKVQPGVDVPPTKLHPIGKTADISPFPAWYFERLEKMAEFTMHATKPNGCVFQVGDNDSGRFLKLHPLYLKMTVAQAKSLYANLDGYTGLPDDEVYWDEVFLDHRHLVSAINGLFNREDFSRFSGKAWLDFYAIRGLSGGRSLPSYLKSREPAAAEFWPNEIRQKKDMSFTIDTVPESQKHVEEIVLPGKTLLSGLTLFAYPDFGLYIYRSDRLFLGVRCGHIGQNGYGGHAHNDHLSVELNVDGRDLIADPGTYLYTPSPEMRNRYRSLKAHFAPRLKEMEFGRLDLGLFQLGKQVEINDICFRANSFTGIITVYGYRIIRHISLTDNVVKIVDSCIPPGSTDFQKQYLEPPDHRKQPEVSFSPSYGRRKRDAVM